MNTQHTPGPWVLEDHGYKMIVSKPGDGYITRDVCRLDGSTMAAFEQIANARLIAAAPELLAELQNIANADPRKWDEETRDQFQQWAQSRARFAIAKVTGGEV